MKLHRIHAAPQASRVQFKHDGVEMTWRGDGATLELKTQTAHRMAVCWNVCEGIPTELLEDGLLSEICNAVAAGDISRAKDALIKIDRGTDTTDGRLHDCESCLSKKEHDDG